MDYRGRRLRSEIARGTMKQGYVLFCFPREDYKGAQHVLCACSALSAARRERDRRGLLDVIFLGVAKLYLYRKYLYEVLGLSRVTVRSSSAPVRPPSGLPCA